MGGFNYPLAWGFLIVAAPLLIHLINVLRLRRVHWAAMDFLMKSYKRHRRWVWLKQLLLLLLRMAAIALLVLMLAQWDPSQEWLANMQQQTTHHFVILDDSYSMGEKTGAARAYDEAIQAIQRVASEAGQETTPQRFTMLRTSRAARAPGDGSAANRVCDVNGVMVDQEFDVYLEEIRRGFDVTQLSVSPTPAIKLARELMDNGLQENRRFYFVSDFREKEWGQPAEIREALEAVEGLGAELHLIRCVDAPQGNLAVTKMEPASDTRAAGVPLYVNVTVKNHAATEASRVQLRIRTRFYSPQEERESPEDAKGEPEDAPVELIESIPPGEEAVVRVQVYFPQAGKHVVEATLPDDAVAADNVRWLVVEFPDFEPTLVIDGDLNQRNGYYLQSIFQPGPRAKTGVRAEVHPPDYLRDVTEDELRRFTTIYLCDVDRLDETAVKRLETFVSEGGGLAVFAGPRVNFRFYNEELHRDGEGLLPAPMGRDVAVRPPDNIETPYVTVEDALHPVFRELFQGNNPFIGLLRVDRSLAPPSEWRPDDLEVAPKVLASLHSGEPLVLERPFGRGRVLQFMTTFAPDWNDMVLGPNVLIALKLQSYLAERTRAARLGDSTRIVGDALTIRAPVSQFRRDWRFSAPGMGEDDRLVIQSAADKIGEDNVWLASLEGEDPALGRGVTDRRGIYEAWLTTNQGAIDVLRYALNVDPSEGELTLRSTQAMLTDLDPVKVTLHDVEDTQIGGDAGGDSRFDWLFALILAAFLIIEQAVAYSASYHPPGGSA